MTGAESIVALIQVRDIPPVMLRGGAHFNTRLKMSTFIVAVLISYSGGNEEPPPPAHKLVGARCHNSTVCGAPVGRKRTPLLGVVPAVHFPLGNGDTSHHCKDTVNGSRKEKAAMMKRSAVSYFGTDSSLVMGQAARRAESRCKHQQVECDASHGLF
jgi:hypothetical protein